MALARLRFELLLALASGSSLERHWLHLSLVHLLLVDHEWWVVVVLTLVAHWHWSGHVLVGVEATEATESSQLSEVVDLDHGWLRLLELLVLRSTICIKVLASVVVAIVSSSLVVVVLHLLRHWRKSHTFWEVWKWIDELSSLLLGMIERASLSELALSFVEEVLAWFSLVVGVDSTESGLTEVLWEWLNQKIKFGDRYLRHLAV